MIAKYLVQFFTDSISMKEKLVHQYDQLETPSNPIFECYPRSNTWYDVQRITNYGLIKVVSDPFDQY